MSEAVQVLRGDARAVLASLPARSAHCCITSPPYFGLRSYNGGAQEIGTEQTPAAYVAALVDVFRSVWRVLRDDGTLFVVIGDSYASGRAYDTSGRAPEDCRGRDSPLTHLCDACRVALAHRTSHNGSQPVDGQGSDLPAPSQEHTGSQNDRLASSDCPGRSGQRRSSLAIADPPQMQGRAAGQPHGAPASNTQQSSLLSAASSCVHCSNCSACLAVLGSSSRDARLCARTSAGASGTLDCTASTAALFAAPSPRTQHTGGSCCINGSSSPLRTHVYAQRTTGVKPKSLLGVPWRVAFALQEDGWLLRQEIIWHKPNPMPESVKDRCTRGHETVFMLAKQPQYYYDQSAIAEESVGAERVRADRFGGNKYGEGVRHSGGSIFLNRSTRNKRSVWTVATAPFSSKKYGVQTEHYAAFPPELVRPMVRAATSERGVCPQCGAPWRRVVERTPSSWEERKAAGHPLRYGIGSSKGLGLNRMGESSTATTRWEPTCSCQAGEPVPATVLDCFCGSGTTGLVAVQEGRRFVGIDLNQDYCALAGHRIASAQPPLPRLHAATG